MTKPISEMTTSELNEAVAVEVMGWTWRNTITVDGWHSKDGNRWFYQHSIFYCPADNDSCHSDCYRAEERMRELGLIEKYTDSLLNIVADAAIFNTAIEVGSPHTDGWSVAFALIHATPRQRCEAMLETVMESHDR